MRRGPRVSVAVVFRLTPTSANLAALALTAFACLPVIGYLAESRALRGIGAAAAMAPFPKVFCDVDGLETFASEFTLHWRDAQGGAHTLPITAELYARLPGAYNRRNVYGAALSYAPRLPEPIWQAVFCHAFAPGGPLRREFELPADATDFAVEIRTKTKGRADRWLLRPTCAR
jgi:hypothetical protein